MDLLCGLILLSDLCPLALALRANRRTTLRQPLMWACAAWLAWTAAVGGAVLRPGEAAPLAGYLALCLTGCAGVAVLGARRPGATAWNFVVVGLLTVLLLPVLNGWGGLRLEVAHELFLAAALAVPLLNYLPTRPGPGALLLAVGCGIEMAGLVRGKAVPPLGLALIAVSPWAAWAGVRSRRDGRSPFDRLWLAHRDRFGFVWGQRMREQFNRAAGHAGWPVELRWGGLQVTAPGAAPPEELLATLRAIGKRFALGEEFPQAADGP